MTDPMTKISTPTEREIEISAVYDAPPEKLFKAYGDPEYISQWLGPSRYETIVDKWDFRKGGMWRLKNRDIEGKETAFRGVYRDIVPNQSITWTFEWEEMPGYVSLETVEFKDLGGKTRVTSHSLFWTQQERDGMINSDMELGVKEGNQRLAELLERM